jgi:hypothetical protein
MNIYVCSSDECKNHESSTKSSEVLHLILLATASVDRKSTQAATIDVDTMVKT